MNGHETTPAGGLAPEGRAGSCAEDDFDPEDGLARWVADIEAGRCRIPDESELAGPAVSISLGDACDLDPALLAAMCGPDGLGGEALGAAFGQDKAADVPRPGPVLSALTEQAVSDLTALSDDQLAGALSAARRLENRAAYLQTIVIAEFARRREVEREQAKSRKVALHCRPGQFPGEELAGELVSTARYADERIWEATDLATRLPLTLAGMADGTIDATRAYLIWSYTWSLNPRDAAHADALLAAAAPGLRTDQLARKAAALEMKLDPEAVKRRREHARQDGRRVEVKHERSGNAILAGRELDPVTALAAKANIDALAVKLRAANWAGSLQHLRGGRGRASAPRRHVRSRRPDRGPGPAACPHQRPGPGRHAVRLVHRPRPGWQLGPPGRGRHQSVRPGAEVQAPPPVQASDWLESRAARTRHLPLDGPLRPHLYLLPHRVRPLALPVAHRYAADGVALRARRTWCGTRRLGRGVPDGLSLHRLPAGLGERVKDAGGERQRVFRTRAAPGGGLHRGVAAEGLLDRPLGEVVVAGAPHTG